MEYIIFKDKNNIINVLSEGKKSTVENLSVLNLTANDSIVTCNQLFTCRAKQFDVCLIEKMIFFPGPKNIRRLYLKYTHKDIDLNNISNILKAILTVYKKQSEQILKLKLQSSVNFHSMLSGYMSFVNNGAPITLTDSFLNSLKDKEEQINKGLNLSRTQLISYLTEKRYNFYDINTGNFKLNHDFLLSLNDPYLNDHVNSEKIKGQYNNVKSFNKENIINHSMWGTVTGRVQTSEPNIQGLKLNSIQPKCSLYSFDFTGFEVVIYLALYNKGLLEEFVAFGKKDIFAFLFYKIYPSKYKFDSDELKDKEIEVRTKFKMLAIRTLYGATEHDVCYWYGDNVKKLYGALCSLLNKDKAVSYLLNYCEKTGRYLINNYINLSIQDRSSFNVYTLKDEYIVNKKLRKTDFFGKEKGISIDYNEQYTKENGVLVEYEDSLNKVKKLCLNYNIQGTGSVIIKKALMNAINSKISSQILILRHDEIIADIVDEEDVIKIKKAMEDAVREVIGAKIHIKSVKIN